VTTDSEAAAAVDATDDEESAPEMPMLQVDDLLPAFRAATPILCLAGQGPLDEAAAMMLAQLLGKHGLNARVESASTLSTQNLFRLETNGAAVICLSYLDASSLAHMRYAVRRLRRKAPKATILLGCWTLERSAEEVREGAKADLLASSLREAVCQCLDAARAIPEETTMVRTAIVA